MTLRQARCFSLIAAFLFIASVAAPALAAPTEIAVDLSGAPVGRVHVEVDGTVAFHALAGEHEIAANDGSWWTGVITEGTTATLRFEAVGEFAFHCARHPDEVGTVVVEPKGGPPPPPENVPPVARFLDPGDGASVTGIVRVRLGGEDPDASPSPVGMRVRVDGGAWMIPVSSNGNEWSFDWNSEAAGNGDHVLEAVASDGASDSAIVGIRVHVTRADPPPPPAENEPPTIAITRPTADAKLRPSELVVTGTAADVDSPESLLRVEISIDGGAWERARGTSDWVFVWDASLAATGPHVIAARASDEESTSPVARLRVSLQTLPAFTPSTPPSVPAPPATASNQWREAALDFGWVAIALVALSGAWAWASSRP